MNYKAAICDDCASDAEYLAALVEAWAKAKGNGVRIKRFSSGEAFLFCYEEEKDFDILFLDIEMGGQNGVELAKRVRQDNKLVQIVFITGFPDFMAEGYEVSALHYLMKPVSGEKICAVLDRAAAGLEKAEKRLKIVFDRQVNLVSFDQILYIEAQKQYVSIHTKEQVYRMKRTLGDLEEELDQRFFRCQRSFLVNLYHVVRVKGGCAVLKNGEEIPISRGMAEEMGKAVIRLF